MQNNMFKKSYNKDRGSWSRQAQKGEAGKLIDMTHGDISQNFSKIRKR